jgi:outer membrane scaffolding protein for murein synthesis (MipA/OmpV family)
MKQTTVLAIAVALTASAAPSLAVEPAPPEKPRLWEIGVGALTGSQQAYPGAAEQTQRTLVLPYAIYRGKVLRTDSGSVGLRAVRTPRFEFDLGLAGSLGSSSARVAVRDGMPDLGTLIEAGPRVRWNLAGDAATGLWRLDLPLRAVFDISDSFKGRGVSFEPELSYSHRTGGWRYSVSGGAVIGSRTLADTFYGVAPEFARADRPAYEARSGLITWRLGGSVSRSLAPGLRAFTSLRFDTVAGAANENSPLVRQRQGWSAGLGLAYTLKSSSQPAFD